MHSGHMLRESTWPEIVLDILGHANIDVTQNIYRKSCAWRKLRSGRHDQDRGAPSFADFAKSLP